MHWPGHLVGGVVSLYEFEEWREVEGYDYQVKVGHWGSVYTRKPGKAWKKSRQTLHSGGYLRVALRKNNRQTKKRVHRMVLEAFVGPCPTGMECRHLNGNKRDNRRDNLAWGTHQENVEDNQVFGRCRGQVLSENQARDIRHRYAEGSQGVEFLAEEYDLLPESIRHVLRGKTWPLAGGPLQSTLSARYVDLSAQQADMIVAEFKSGVSTFKLAASYNTSENQILRVLKSVA